MTTERKLAKPAFWWGTHRAVIVLASALLSAPPLLSAQATATHSTSAWHYDPDAGAVYQRGDFRLTVWGFAERYWGPSSTAVNADAWRRVRQGMQADLPRFNRSLRSAIVYEVDATNTNFFRSGRTTQAFENLYLAIQNADDAGRFRALFGENTHVLSREDNLSSGNLPTINRSLILEEHGSVNSFGTQWGAQVFRALSRRASLAVSLQDNRGSLNSASPSYRVGNSTAAKLTFLALSDSARNRRLVVGGGADFTRAIYDRTFTLSSAIGAEPLGGTTATGNKLSVEGDLAYTWSVGPHPFTLEGEYLRSDFSHSLTDVSGGYVSLQASAFDAPGSGDLDPFLRYDRVRLGREAADGVAVQQAWRMGVNYNLPYAGKHASLHIEYALNRVDGPQAIVPVERSFTEWRIETRVNAARYLRH